MSDFLRSEDYPKANFGVPLAGSLILLSLTGVLLWTELNKRKTAGAAIVTVSLIAMVVCGLM